MNVAAGDLPLCIRGGRQVLVVNRSIGLVTAEQLVMEIAVAWPINPADAR
jgi:hypothetical protein